MSTRTAVAVQRLLDAGASLVGKTNLPPYGGGIETDNEVFGRTSNPYDRTRTVGGSSGGEAAAVASGLSRFGLGTDSGASVRLPAHFCGVVGLKPTAGRVPVDGVIDDLGPIGAMRDPRTQIGVLARTVADVELVLSVISDRPGVGLSSTSRVGLWLGDDVCAETAAVVRAAADVLDAEPVAVPEGGHAVTVSIWQSYGDGAIAYDTLRRWDALRADWRRLGERFDVILSPVFPTPAPAARRTRERARPHALHERVQPHRLAGGDRALRDQRGRVADRRPGGGAAVGGRGRAGRRWRAGARAGRLRRAMTAIPGPTASASLQTARWLARPIRFLEDNRRRYGDAFTVMFKGFKTPLVIVSHPSVLRALYGERGHLMPPGRQVTLKPLVGARSLLLLEGAEHLSRRKVMLPPFRGDRMRAYEPIMRDASARELAAWPVGRAFAVHPSMQSITLDVILQAVFGVSDEGRRARLHQLLG